MKKYLTKSERAAIAKWKENTTPHERAKQRHQSALNFEELLRETANELTKITAQHWTSQAEHTAPTVRSFDNWIISPQRRGTLKGPRQRAGEDAPELLIKAEEHHEETSAERPTDEAPKVTVICTYDQGEKFANDESPTDRINVSLSKFPTKAKRAEGLAREIARRLLPDYLKEIEARAERAQTFNQELQALDALSQLLESHGLRPDSGERHRSDYRNHTGLLKGHYCKAGIQNRSSGSAYINRLTIDGISEDQFKRLVNLLAE